MFECCANVNMFTLFDSWLVNLRHFKVYFVAAYLLHLLYFVYIIMFYWYDGLKCVYGVLNAVLSVLHCDLVS